MTDTSKIRRTIARMSHQANSAHFGSSLSCVEIISAILSVSNIRPDTVSQPGRDRLIVSKGHAAMGYYAALNAHGLIDSKLLEDYLGCGTALWGHVTRTKQVPAIDASTGSLGHGLSLALGYAQAYRLRRYTGRIFCVLSDGELDEGSTWEAALFAGAKCFGNLVAVVDCNRIQSLDRVDNVLPLAPLADKWQAFRWDVEVADGHDEAALIAILSRSTDETPRVILANTVKGKGVPRIEDTIASHYAPALADDASLFG